MKKIYFLISGLLLTASAANAQLSTQRAYLPFEKNSMPSRISGLTATDRAPGDIIIEDDFSDFGNWITYTEGGTIPEWELVMTTPTDLVDYMDVFVSPTNANGFAAFNGVQYLIDVDVPPIDALIEYGASINCTGTTAVTLKFFMAYRAFNTDKVFVEVTNNDWASFTAIELFPSMPTNAPTEQELIIKDISSVAAGESDVKVRFRFQELGADDEFGSGYGAMIDDFMVQEAWNYDQEITASYHRSGLGISQVNGLEYHFVPEAQLTPITFIGETQNLGALPATGAKLNVSVTGAGSYSGTSVPETLPVGAADSMTCTTTFTPSALGTYDVTFWFDGINPEEETSNDSMYLSFDVTDHIYGRDNGFATSSIGNVSGNEDNPLLIGNTMDIFADDVIGAVDIAVSADPSNIGKLIFAQIMILQLDGTFLYVGQTDDHTITASENGGFITLYFWDEPVEVEAGQTILVLAGHYGGDNEARFRLAQGVDEQTVLGFTSGATDPFFLADPSAVMIRVHTKIYSSGIGIDETGTNNFSIGQNIPNPFGENAVINYELKEAGNVSIEFIDVTGKLVKSINSGTQAAGNYSVQIDANDFAEGIYFYTFTVGSEKVTKRMVVTK
jgi:hypothetical protein